MVSLEEKFTYQGTIEKSPKLSAFNNLLLGNQVLNKIGLNETDEIYYGLLTAIQTNNKEQFETHYNKRKKSNPNRESPYPYDQVHLFKE